MAATPRARLALSALLLAATSAGAAADKGADPEPPPDRKAELRKWTGTFSVVLFQRDGNKSSDDELKTMKVVLKEGDGSFHTSYGVFTSQAVLFPEKKPREVDSMYTNGPLQGKVVKGIYKIEGDRFTACYAEVGKDRPREFKSVPGTGHTLYVLERQKEK